MGQVFFSVLPRSEVPQAHRIETACFPPNEAESLPAFFKRQSESPELFYGAYLPSSHVTPPLFSDQPAQPELIGFICASRSISSTILPTCFSESFLEGRYVVLQSVCVATTFRSCGLGKRMLGSFVEYVKALEGVVGARLLSHEELVSWYERAGWRLQGKSEVRHGERDWYEMRMDFGQT